MTTLLNAENPECTDDERAEIARTVIVKNTGNQRMAIRATSASDLYGQIRKMAARPIVAEPPGPARAPVGCTVATPAAIHSALVRLIGGLRRFNAGPVTTRTFCAAGPRENAAILSIKNPGMLGAVRVWLEERDGKWSLWQEQFACYVLITGRRAGRVQTLEGEPASRALRVALGHALADTYCEIGLFAG
jgi:hypothetical protein